MPKLLVLLMLLLTSFSLKCNEKDIIQELKDKTREINNARIAVGTLEDEKNSLEYSLIVYQHYASAGTISKNNITSESLYNIERCLKKYKFLAPHYNFDTFKPIILGNMWISAESGFNTSSTCKYTNVGGLAPGSIDLWVMCMNQCHYNESIPNKNYWRIADRMFPYLADRPDSDPEKNIVAWYLWLDKQSEKTNNGVWQLYNKWRFGIKGKLKPRPDVIELYEKLKIIK
jgi:hypothetical protein